MPEARADRGRWWSRLSEDTGSTDEAPALPGDGLREAIVDELRRAHRRRPRRHHLKPQRRPVGPRRAPTRGRPTGRALREATASTYFCFLSAIDWMPSPYGRGEDDPTQPPPERSTDDRAGLRRRRDALPGVRPGHRHRAPRRRHGQGRRARRRRSPSTPGIAVYARRQLARARDARDVRHRLRRPPRPAQHLPARPSSRATRCARTSRCSPAS